MAEKARSRKKKAAETNGEPGKEQLQRQMARTRESLAETVGEIKETVAQEVQMVKKSVAGVLDYREEFQKDPVVWSLGALSAGFALGYTLGYAHKNSKGGKQNQLTAFADNMIEQISGVGQGLVLPALDAKISELFGFDFSAMLEKAASTKGSQGKKKKRERTSRKAPAKSTRSKKKASRS